MKKYQAAAFKWPTFSWRSDTAMRSLVLQIWDFVSRFGRNDVDRKFFVNKDAF